MPISDDEQISEADMSSAHNGRKGRRGSDQEKKRANYEMITREEVYFTGKENIEGYACLVNIFLKSLLHSSDSPALINVDNHEDFNECRILEGQLFF